MPPKVMLPEAGLELSYQAVQTLDSTAQTADRYSPADKIFYLIEHVDFDIVQAVLLSSEQAKQAILVELQPMDAKGRTIENVKWPQLDALSFAVLMKKYAVMDFLLTLNPPQLTKSLVLLKAMVKSLMTKCLLSTANKYLTLSVNDFAEARLTLLLTILLFTTNAPCHQKLSSQSKHNKLLAAKKR